MAEHLVPVSPPIHVTVSDPAGGTSPALLLAIRWNDEANHTELFVASRHHGTRWVEQEGILEAWSE
jgi:hypothetical protein